LKASKAVLALWAGAEPAQATIASGASIPSGPGLDVDVGLLLGQNLDVRRLHVYLDAATNPAGAPLATAPADTSVAAVDLHWVHLLLAVLHGRQRVAATPADLALAPMPSFLAVQVDDGKPVRSFQ
jgi:hypothetical protein